MACEAVCGGIDAGAISFALKVGRADRPDQTVLRAEEMRDFRRTVSNGVVRLTWSGSRLLGEGFEATAELTPCPDGYDYTFSYRGNGSDWDVEEIDFPRISLRKTDATRIFNPQKIGRVVRPDWDGTEADGRIGSVGPGGVGLHFTAALDVRGGGSVYVDQRGEARMYAIRYETWRGTEPDAFSLGLIHEMPITSETRRAYALPYGGTIRAFRGGWFEAAAIYRAWVREQDWYKRLKARDFSRLRDVSLWMWNRGPSAVTVPPVLKFMEDTGLKVALDWYWWHAIPYDTCYPFFWPPREPEADFRAAIGCLHSRGAYVQTYTNGILWDMDDVRWAEGGDRCVIMDRRGQPRSVVYNPFTNHRQAHMCGEAPEFQEKCRETVRTLRGTGLDGVYLDQIATVMHGSCFNPAHRHPRGGGRHMADGYRRNVGRIRAENPGLMLSGEEEGEAYLDLFDSFISVHASAERIGAKGAINGDEFVPAFPAVYHGAVPMFGSYATIGNVPPWDPEWGKSPFAENLSDPYAGEDIGGERTHPEQFAVEFARGVVWGLQPTVHKFLLEHAESPRYADDYAFMKGTAAFYRANRDLLFDGEMLSPGTLSCAVREVAFLQRGAYARPEEVKTARIGGIPAVMHSVWRAPDGRIAAVLVNWTREEQSFGLKSEAVSGEGVVPPRSWTVLTGGK